MNEDIKHITLSKTDDVYRFFEICEHHCSNIEHGIAFFAPAFSMVKTQQTLGLDEKENTKLNRRY